MIKAIIFDFFDVVRRDPYKFWLKKHGFERTGKFVEVVEKMDVGKIDMNEFLELLGRSSGQSLDEVAKEFDEAAILNFEIIELIKTLRTDYKIGLLSNAPSDFIRKLLQKDGLEQYFDEIVISSEVGYIKPNKEIFDIMLKRLDINSSEALFIDDSKSHVDGAEKAGIKSIQFESAVQLQHALFTMNIIGSNRAI